MSESPRDYDASVVLYREAQKLGRVMRMLPLIALIGVFLIIWIWDPNLPGLVWSVTMTIMAMLFGLMLFLNLYTFTIEVGMSGLILRSPFGFRCWAVDPDEIVSTEVINIAELREPGRKVHGLKRLHIVHLRLAEGVDRLFYTANPQTLLKAMDEACHLENRQTKRQSSIGVATARKEMFWLVVLAASLLSLVAGIAFRSRICVLLSMIGFSSLTVRSLICFIKAGTRQDVDSISHAITSKFSEVICGRPLPFTSYRRRGIIASVLYIIVFSVLSAGILLYVLKDSNLWM